MYHMDNTASEALILMKAGRRVNCGRMREYDKPKKCYSYCFDFIKGVGCRANWRYCKFVKEYETDFERELNRK